MKLSATQDRERALGQAGNTLDYWRAWILARWAENEGGASATSDRTQAPPFRSITRTIWLSEPDDLDFWVSSTRDARRSWLEDNPF